VTLIALDEDENVVATLDVLVVRDADGKPALVDFEAHEKAGGRLRDIWDVSGAVRSTVEHREPAAQTPPDAPRRPIDLPLVGRGR